jgi:hypothetical protein
MNDGPADILFPGVKDIRGVSYTMAHGVQPGVIKLTVFQQPPPKPRIGDLIITHRDQKIIVRDCLLVGSSRSRVAAQSDTMEVTLLDFRWRWSFGTISGHYNLPSRRTGKRRKDTELSAPELAALCVFAAKTANVNVNQMPKDAFPETHWDHETPAVALAELCRETACRIIPTTDGAVRIEPTGQGRELPEDGLMVISKSESSVPRPSSIMVVGGPTRVQHDFFLTAVGLERDGSIRPIDGLSYRPAAGWESLGEVEDFSGLGDIEATKLAKASVYRMYQIQIHDTFTRDPNEPLLGGRWHGTDHNLNNIAGVYRISKLEQILPIDSVQVETVHDIEGRDVPRPAEVWGVFGEGTEEAPNKDDPEPQDTELLGYREAAIRSFYEDGFSIDEEYGIVRFGRPVYRYNTLGQILPALLALRTAVNIRDAETRALLRYQDERKFVGGKPDAAQRRTGPRLINRPELIGAIHAEAKSVLPFRLAQRSTNQNLLIAKSDQFFNRELAILEAAQNSQTGIYEGLVNVPLDGAIQSITWTVDPRVTTTVQRNIDPLDVPTYDEPWLALMKNGGIQFAESDKLRHVNSDQAYRES